MTEAAAGMAGEGGGAGAELTRAREALGLSIADVARQLKFAPRQIEALEQERFRDLPGRAFARGMLRAYARMLKLDPDALVGRVAAHLATPDNTLAVASVNFAIPITDSTRRTNLTYVALSAVMLVVIVAVAIDWQKERLRATRLSFVSAAQEPQGALAPDRSPVASEAIPSAAVPLKPVGAESPAVAATTEGGRRLVMRFERQSWVEVRGRGGKLLMSKLNAAGTERQIEGEPPFRLIIGNAQHVRLTYGDQRVDLAPYVKVGVARFTLE